MKKGPAPQLAIGIGALLAGVAIDLGALGISSEAGYSGVGPNFLPWVVGTLLALCGVMLVREVLTGGFRNLEEPSGAPSGHWPGFAWVTAGILLNAALITTIGFAIAAPVYWMFSQLLGINLPGLTSTGWI